MNRIFRKYFLCIIIFSVGFPALAQKQVVFIQHGNIIARFTEGDKFKFKLKGHSWKEGYITELNDFSMVTSALDTISFLSIEKISIKGQRRRSFVKTIGGVLMAGGLLYIAIDQANVLYGSSKSGFDESNRGALVTAGLGALLLFIKPTHKNVTRGVSVRTIDYKSPLYQFK